MIKTPEIVKIKVYENKVIDDVPFPVDSNTHDGINSPALSGITLRHVTIAGGTISGSMTEGTIGGVDISNIAFGANDNANAVISGLVVSSIGIATANDGTQSAYVVLAWTANSEATFDHYLVRYKKGSYTYYQYIPSNINTITIEGLVPNTAYNFAVAAVNKFGISSAFCADISQTTASDTAAPATVTAGSATGGIQYVILEWTHNSEADLASYNIYRSETNNSATAALIGNCRTNYFVDGNRVGGTTYYYWVKAVDTSGNVSAAFSTVKSAAPRNVTSDDIVTIAGSKVLIDGTVYLSNWRHGGDLTKIDGGNIYTGSVTTTQLNFTPVQSTDVIAKINASAEGITIDADNITINGSTTFGSGYNPTTKVDEVGGTYDSAASGARVRIFPDANTGIQVIDDAAADVFKCIVGGTNVGDVQIGNYASGQGALYDKSAGLFNFKGTIVAGTVFVGTDVSLIELASQADFPPDTNLVGYWSFDEGSGTVANDGSNNGNNLTITNATHGVGPEGNCLVFDGAGDYCTLGTNIAFGANYTLAFWGKIQDQDYLGIVASQLGSYGYLRFGTSAGGEISNIYGETNTDGDDLKLDFNSPISYDTWYHFAISQDGSKVWRLYINGVLQTDTATTTNAAMTIARIGNGRANTDWFKGSICGFRVYSAKLTDAQVYALYKNPGQGKSLAVPVGRLTSGYILSRQIWLGLTGTDDCYIAGGDTGFDFANWRGGTSTLGAFALGIDNSVANDPAKFFVGNFYTHKYFQFDGEDIIQTGVMVNQFFGDGSDGSVTFDGSSAVTGATRSGSTYTLTRNVYYYDMTVNAGVTIKPAGYRIFNLGTYHFHGTIDNTGSAGSPGTNNTDTPNIGGAGGAGGAGAARGAGSFDRMEKGSDGGDGGNGGVPTSHWNGYAGENGESLNPSVGGIDGIAGGNGGESSGYTKGSGGTAGVATNEDIELNFRDHVIEDGTVQTLTLCVERLIRGVTSGDGLSVPAGSGGGGGGTAYPDHGASGGGAGGGGGIVYIAARIIDPTSDGTITVKGGMGEAGHSSSSGAAGGGGPGNGGIIIMLSTSASTVGSITYNRDGGDLNGSAGQTFNGYSADRPDSNGYNAAEDGHNGKFYYLRVKGII